MFGGRDRRAILGFPEGTYSSSLALCSLTTASIRSRSAGISGGRSLSPMVMCEMSMIRSGLAPGEGFVARGALLLLNQVDLASGN